MGIEHLPVTIIMPVRNEASFIRRSLEAVLAQDYPAQCMEIIVADGMSDDGTREIIRSLQQKHPNLRLVDNPQQIVPTGLNTAIRHARGDVIIRIDGHALVEPDYVRTCVEWLQKTGADCVGGAIESIGEGYVGQSIAFAMSSPFGVGGSGFRTASINAEPTLTDTVPFGAYRRHVFDSSNGGVGLFNEDMVRHQDYEFCYRLRQNGGRIYLLPHLRALYYVRGSLRRLRRQYWQYGIWKGRFLRTYPASLRFRHFVPPLFMFALFITGLLAAILPASFFLFAAILTTYLLFLTLAALRIGIRNGLKYAPILPLILATLHINWGLGVWIGLFSPLLTKKSKTSPPDQPHTHPTHQPSN